MGHNGHDWKKWYEQKFQKELQSDAEESIHDLTISEEGRECEPEGGETDGRDHADGGGDHAPKRRAPPKAYPGVGIGLETPIGRIVHDKDVRDRVLSYVDMMSKYASLEHLDLPQFSVDDAHRHVVMHGVVVSFLPNDDYTQVLFHFVTHDGIPCSISELMEMADLEETEKQIEKYLQNRRREDLLGGKARVIH